MRWPWLVTYASYPSTEYLDATLFDFATFNVYLHDREAFRRYLFRLQNLVGDRPLILGELGMDTLRHGELEQAAFLQGHLQEATLMGLAGAFIFSWTDDWHTGGHQIEDWAFGITHADRAPKAAFHAVAETFERPTAEWLPARPRVSVVVCSYNGGRTLGQCLQSLRTLDYPDYEVILVDDGSTDGTPEIAARFPEVRTIRQDNQGLSVARNVGMRAATGAIIAYTDSDCFADPDWLTHLVYQLDRSGAAAVGGPNLTPEDGWLASCVAASPGQPTHVLESDQVAEHIPGCNMAFRREALEAIHGFEPQYRKAGDDVDVCWRLQHEGHRITFAPGAFVWHHRRQTPRTYLRQQAGYGEAEALLRFKHPDKFNGRGDGKWRGVMYGDALAGLRLAGSFIYRGTFGTGLFQTLYQPGPAHWAMLPGTLEWQLAAVLIALMALALPGAWWLAGSMLGLTLLVAVLQGAQAHLAPEHDGPRSRCVVAVLCYLQPLVRSWARYRTRLFSRRAPILDAAPEVSRAGRSLWAGSRTVDYWSERWDERTALLDQAVAYLEEHHWGQVIDSGWSDWDLEIACHRWASVQVCTVQEDHGSGRRLIRVRYRLRSNRSIGWAGIVAAEAGVAVGPPTWLAVAGAVAFLAAALGMWCASTRRATHVMAVFDGMARRMGLIPCDPSPEVVSSSDD